MMHDLLVRTFFERFFDNEITGGTNDLRSSFFWMLAFFAAPGLFMPVLMSFAWDGAAIVHGPEGLRILSRGDKVLYLGFAMIASGLVSAITWSSLLLDRRDCLVLGTLPVTGGRIVRAKLTALCVYIGTVAVGMNTLASLSFGFGLATHASPGFAIAGSVAHFVASCAMTVFVMFAVVATQGVIFVLLGPRRFNAISPWLQTSVVAVVLIGLMLLPVVSVATVPTLTGNYIGTAPWILRLPPLWFLGVYEMVLRTDDPQLIRLSVIGLAGLAGTALVTFITYPLAYRRLASAVVAMPAPRERHGWTGRIIEGAVSLVSFGSVTRASSQFFLIAIRRSTRHRLTAAMAFGVALAAISPTIVRWSTVSMLPATPPVDLLAAPLVTMLALLVGLRIAAALPADLDSGWMLDSVGAPPAPMRSGLWRTMFVAVVLPTSILTAAIYWQFWGSRWALVHATTCLVVGAVLIEMLLWGFAALPCSRPWRPEQASLRKWWPAYLGLFLFITGGIPWIEQLCFEERTGFTALIGIIAATGAVLRVTHLRRRIMPAEDLNEPATVQVLNLD